MDWETVGACNFCGHTSVRLYMKAKIANWYANRPLRLVECRACNLVYVSPRPVFPYPGPQSDEVEGQIAFERKSARKNVAETHRRHLMNAIERLGTPARSLFDMGCGAGTLMTVAQEAGLEVAGNEINPYSVRKLTAEGFKIYASRNCELKVDRTFDIVINFDCLEHSYEPFDDLQMCHKLLNDGGILHLKTLFLNSYHHREEGAGWRLFGKGHFHFFTPDVLLSMIRKAGFQIEHVETSNLIFVTARKRNAAIIEEDPSKSVA